MEVMWRAGAASREFSVPAGTPMGGYVARSGPSTGTLDPLSITALWLETGESRLAIVSADIVAVDAALTASVAKAAGIRREELLLAASHTHSGPAGISHKLHPANIEEIDHQLRRAFVLTCAEALQSARDQIEAATISLGQASASGLASNRNHPDWTDDDTHDPGITVLEVLSYALTPLATLVFWPCHPTILGAENRLISADFPGALRNALREEAQRPELPVLFVNGAAGDVSTRFTRREQSAAEVDRIGREVAAAALRASEGATPLSPLLRHETTTVSLRGWTEAEIAAHLQEPALPLNREDRRDVTRDQGRAMLEHLASSPCRPRRRSARIDGWRVGEAILVAIPGELFSSLGAEISRAVDGPVIVAGYAGGYVGYLADREAYRAGTYEALASALGPGSGETVTRAALRIVRSLVRYQPVAG